ncbi:uncharacterized protein HMPREF1541_07108 [Cyphellophora europaea CBS 101466]|uniref:Uncharacterized protein n=1 Tax=Cyphellophora europaea (strain CBS 101466) TaxID=1220924 RepID=W2RLV4_CYPE1|nr:uncharacterized protein HMPREF1541_07108 [Cyphellophora europaea CBS 101466]ETN37486.1 hypothetical protein HMPREF1541_07108 [Cyphellophora europaea CBS 101466]
MAGNYVTEASVRATGISLVALTSLIAGLRVVLAIQQQKGFHWDDGWLLAAYISFLVLSSLYLIAAPIIFRIEQVGQGKLEPYPDIARDGLFIQKIFFVTTSALWMS